MEKPVFNNKPNQHVIYHYNDKIGVKIHQDFFISRSVAVVGVILAITNDNIRILITKRSDKMMDEAGKFGVPCGYIDWGETTYDAMLREVYEETSLYIPNYLNFIKFDNNKKPFIINDNPASHNQNISFIYITALDFSDKIQEFPIDIIKYKDRETAEVKWISVYDFFNVYEKGYDWAFNHNNTIKDAITFFNDNFKK